MHLYICFGDLIVIVIIKEWLVDKVDRNVSHQYVWNRDQFMTVDGTSVDYLLGLI